jgi:two-component system, OmpR family, sensor kinase
MNDLRLPAALAPRPDDVPEDAAYFVILRTPETVLKSSPELSDATCAALQIDPDTLTSRPWLRQRGTRREIVQRGPRTSIIVVGKPITRELDDLARLGGQLTASGCLALVVGLAGGWLISRGIVTPIARISTTAGAISAANLSGRIVTDRLDTELVGLAQVLNQMFTRLEDEFSRQSRFTADASHELRTPLALLCSQIELSLKRPRSADEYREALETCRRAAERMRSLTDSLLTLARADSGRLALSLQPVGLAELLAETVEMFEKTAEDNQVRLTVEPHDVPVMVQGDPIFLSRVLANLLSNALRHTPTGGSVDVLFGTRDHDAWFSVTDTGSGIPLNDQPRIFERFFRADKARSRSSGGSGLGLAICKSIVDAHGGAISCTSIPGQGTSFTVRLPLNSVKVDGAPALSTAG